MRSKRLVLAVFILPLALAVLFPNTAHAFFFKKKTNDDASVTARDKKVIAIIPVQKNIPQPIYLSTSPGTWESFSRMFQEKKLLRNQVDYDPEFVQTTLNQDISKKILDSGYLIYLPEDVGPRFRELSILEDEGFSTGQLNAYFEKADAYFFATLTKWDAENFDHDGKVRAGFQAFLINAKDNHVIWSNTADEMTIESPSDATLYRKYQKDVLSILTVRMMKGFSKNGWEE